MAPGIASVRHDYEHDYRFQRKMRRVHGENADSLFWGWFNGWTNPDIKDWDMRPQIKGIECPTLVVQGLEDEHASPQHAREIVEAIPNAELWLLPDVGHMPAQEIPAEFNQKILHFIRNSQTEETTKLQV
jgi:pimeloyl-ACP methyl ester carboxylesterase